MFNRHLPTAVPFVVLAFTAAPAFADGAFYGDPPDATHPWTVHDMNRPQPPIVTPGTFSSQEQPGKPPSDAVVLFDGTAESLAKWEADKPSAEPTKWIVKDGNMQCVPGSGYIRTKEQFGDMQLHVEWSAPSEVKGDSQGRGNSGVFLMGITEVQVLDNFNNPSYPDGFAGSVYGVNPPHANPLNAPGAWQVYDIIFRRPIYKDGKLLDAGRMTVTLNGVVVQDSTPLEGGTSHKMRHHDRPFPEQGPLKLQDHGNPVRFRNIWCRPLPKRAVDGGDMGVMDPAAATAKKLEIAATIRSDAAKLQGQAKLLRQMESLCYAPDAATGKDVEAGLTTWIATVKQIPAAGMEAKKGEIMEVYNAVKYLVEFQFLPADFSAKPELEAIITAAGWKLK